MGTMLAGLGGSTAAGGAAGAAGGAATAGALSSGATAAASSGISSLMDSAIGKGLSSGSIKIGDLMNQLTGRQDSVDAGMFAKLIRNAELGPDAGKSGFDWESLLKK